MMDGLEEIEQSYEQSIVQSSNLDPSVDSGDTTAALNLSKLQSSDDEAEQTDQAEDPKVLLLRHYLRACVHIDLETVPYAKEVLCPMPVKALPQLYHSLVQPNDQVPNNRLYKSLNSLIKSIKLEAMDMAKKFPQQVQRLLKENKRKEQKEFGERFDLKGVNMYHGLQLVLPDFSVNVNADPHFESLKVYVTENSIEVPQSLAPFHSQSAKKKHLLPAPTSPIAEYKKPRLTLNAVKASVYPMNSMVPPPLYMYEEKKDHSMQYIVEILKLPGTVLTLSGPDTSLCYMVEATYPEKQAEYAGLPQGTIKFLFRVPVQYDSIPAHIIPKKEEGGLVRLSFSLKDLSSEAVAL